MGITSAKVKNAWTAKNYERVSIVIKKGEKDRIKTAASASGISMNRFIVNCINASAGNILTILDDESKKKGKSDNFPDD